MTQYLNLVYPHECEPESQLLSLSPPGPCWHTLLCAHLLFADIQDTFQRQLLKVKAIALIEVGADRLGVVVDHHRLLAHLSQSSDAGDSAPVKLHTAAWWKTQQMGLR